MGEKADSNSYVESIDISLENEEPLYIQIVTDTALNKNYIMETFLFEKLIPRKQTEWREVICESDFTREILNDIVEKLISAHYLGERHITYDIEVRKALVEFQKDNNLPVGHVDLETLKHLGITEW